MNNMESTAKVYETSDYAKFKMLKGNRPIKEAHLKFLKESISKNGDLGVPIIVNEKFEMIDGQHRVKALEELGFPVQYLMKKGFELEQVHVLNCNRKNWTMTEFMNCYADIGIEYYIRYREFYEKYGFSQTATLIIVVDYKSSNRNVRHGQSAESFKRGEFIFKNSEEAEDRADKILMLKDVYYNYKNRTFVEAMVRLFKIKNYNHSEFLSRFRQKVNVLIELQPRTVNGYLRIFEDIYNSRRPGRKIKFYQDLKRPNGK